jgi:hypothetical protein
VLADKKWIVAVNKWDVLSQAAGCTEKEFALLVTKKLAKLPDVGTVGEVYVISGATRFGLDVMKAEMARLVFDGRGQVR